MNKLLLICGFALLGGVIAQESKESAKVSTETQEIYTTSNVSQDLSVTNPELGQVAARPKSIVISPETDCKEKEDLDLNEIAYIEEEPQIDLGFDTADYLPEGFDPYKLYVNLKTIEYVQEQEDVKLGFNTIDYLPSNFNPYADPLDVESINYIEEEGQIELGFNSADYLPKNFNPYTPRNNAKEVTAI